MRHDRLRFEIPLSELLFTNSSEHGHLSPREEVYVKSFHFATFKAYPDSEIVPIIATATTVILVSYCLARTEIGFRI